MAAAVIHVRRHRFPVGRILFLCVYLLFVLVPLYSIAPDVMIPGKGKVVDLLQACRSQHIEVVDSIVPAR